MIGTCEWAVSSPATTCDRGASQTVFIPNDGHGLRGRLVARSPEELHLHPALVRLNLVKAAVEPTQACRLNGRPVSETIRITTNGTIVSGFRDWYAAVNDACRVVDCIEYPLTEEEALQYTLINHRPRPGWNGFTRIRLALELEPFFQAKAIANQTDGGKLKGLANLPKASRVDVRHEIALLAGVGSRNVGNVKTILQKSDPRLIEALQNGTLSINRAVQWCTLSRVQQVEQFSSWLVERASSKVTRQSIAQLRIQRPGPHPVAVLNALQLREAQAPGSVVVRAASSRQTVILLGQDLLTDLHSQAEPTLS
jgi:hypothetical protein